MKTLLYTFVLTILALTNAGCKTDASVSLAECIGVSFNKLIDSNRRKITSQCNIGLVGNYVAVLHPAVILSDEAYKAQGLNDKTVKILRSLQASGAGYESIYIIPLNGQELPSRTTSQGKTVSVRNLLVVKKAEPLLTFTLEWFPDEVRVVDLK